MIMTNTKIIRLPNEQRINNKIQILNQEEEVLKNGN
jgi:hypothetical protein